MVKEIGRDQIDNEIDDRARGLVGIARSVLGSSYSLNDDFLTAWLSVRHHSKHTEDPIFHIYPGRNRIDVYSPEYLDIATKVAVAFEDSGESEFTVKKDYKESPQPIASR